MLFSYFVSSFPSSNGSLHGQTFLSTHRETDDESSKEGAVISEEGNEV